jgi:hypothetical protein
MLHDQFGGPLEDSRMEDAFEVATRFGIVEDDGPQRGAVKYAIAGYLGAEASKDGCQSRGPWHHDFARDLIGVNHWHALLAQDRLYEGLATGDVSSQAVDPQCHEAVSLSSNR